MTPTIFNSGSDGWTRALAGLNPADAAEFATDDIGPSRGKMMRRNGRGLHRELTQLQRRRERQARQLERREQRRQRVLEQIIVPSVVTPVSKPQITISERRAA